MDRRAIAILSACAASCAPVDVDQLIFTCRDDTECAGGRICHPRDQICVRPGQIDVGCGNGVLDEGEECDDPDSARGCVECKTQWGWTCAGALGAANRCQATRFIDVSCGNYTMCALTEDGAVLCRGDDLDVDDRSSGQTRPPRELPPLASLSLRGRHACGLDRDRRAYCWGSNLQDYDGDTSYAGQAIVPGDLPPLAELVAGHNNTCGITVAGETRCWGGDQYDQSSPPAGVQLSTLALGASFACGVDKNTGEAICWGNPESDRTKVPRGAVFLRLGTGNFHTCGVTPERSLICWGKESDPARPMRTVPPAASDYEDLAGGIHHTCARKTDGAVVCWGERNSVELGQFDPPAGAFAKIAAGTYHSCGLRPDGTIECWGREL